MTALAGYPQLDVTLAGVSARLLAPEPPRTKERNQRAVSQSAVQLIEMQSVDIPAMRVRRYHVPGTSELRTDTAFFGTVGVATSEPTHLKSCLAEVWRVYCYPRAQHCPDPGPYHGPCPMLLIPSSLCGRALRHSWRHEWRLPS